MAKAIEAGPDAVILDLEDAVSDQGKSQAREMATESIGELYRVGIPAFVRINALSTPHWLDDLIAIVGEGLAGVALPKAYGPDEFRVVDHVIGALEKGESLAPRSVEIQPLFETASAMVRGFDVLSASSRILSYHAGTARNGDVNHTLGYVWTADGKETLYLRSKLLMDGRAAGVPYPLTGVWTDIRDDDGFRGFAREGRQLGYTGMYLIHPRHVQIANEIFTPSSEDVAYFKRLMKTLEDAESESGSGAVALDGEMVDAAMMTRGNAVLELARILGVPGA